MSIPGCLDLGINADVQLPPGAAVPPEIILSSPVVQPRVDVAAPALSDAVSAAVARADRRRAAAGEVSDPDGAETLSQLPGASSQSLHKFDSRKAVSDRISAAFARGGRDNLAAKVGGCSPYMRMSQRERGGRWSAFTVSCKVRECPMCDHRAAAKRGRLLSDAVSKVQAAHPAMRWIFLTLTVKNVPLRDLRMTVLGLNASWKRLMELRDVGRCLIGWSRAVEVTRGQDGLAHPHIHALLGVSSTYFKGDNYLSQEAWAALWKQSARLDYEPLVHVQALKKPSVDEGSKGLASGIHEVTKAAGYSVKASQLQLDDAWLCELHEQQSKLHFFSAGGELKAALKSLNDSDDEDEIGDDQEPLNCNDIHKSLMFHWRSNYAQYRRKR